jgi:hypothetical protein
VVSASESLPSVDSNQIADQTAGMYLYISSLIMFDFQEGEKYPTFSLTFPACVRTFQEISEQEYPDRDNDDPDVHRAMEIARDVQQRMLVEMENVWPKIFYTGYVASMCNICVKDLLFLTDTAKRNRAIREFKSAVVECCKRKAARAATANAVAPSVSEQSAASNSEQKAPDPASVRARELQQPSASDQVQQLFKFNPLKPRRAEQEFKERLMKQRAEQDRASDAHMNDPTVKLEREVDDEVERYLRVGQQENANPLAWWREHRKEFPKIAPLAQTMNAIPASSAGAERVFKSLSLALSKRRRRLRDRNAENMVFIHENRQFFAPKIWALEQQRHRAKELRKAQEAGDPDPSADD